MSSSYDFFQEKDKYDYKKKKYLSDVCHTGSLDLVKECIRRRRESSILSPREIDKALFTSCKRGYTPIVKELLKEGGDIFSCTSCDKCDCERDGEYASSPLKVTIEKGRKKIFILLLENEMKRILEKKKEYETGWGLKYFQEGEEYSYGEYDYNEDETRNIIEYIFRGKGKVKKEFAFYLEYLYENQFLEGMREHNIQDNFSRSCYKGYTRGVQIFLEMGADINKHPRWEYHEITPLLIACKMGHEEVAYELISSGANLSCIAKVEDLEMKRKMEDFIQKIGNIKPAKLVSEEKLKNSFEENKSQD